MGGHFHQGVWEVWGKIGVQIGIEGEGCNLKKSLDFLFKAHISRLGSELFSSESFSYRGKLLVAVRPQGVHFFLVILGFLISLNLCWLGSSELLLHNLYHLQTHRHTLSNFKEVA